MTEPDTVRRLLDALDFAARTHAGQTRKGAAALHDVVEDTGRTLEEVRSRFGGAVAALVAEVTDDRTLRKDERKRRQVELAPRTSDGAKRIKLADKASNLAALADSPPYWWDRGRKQADVQWARDVVAALRGADPAIEVAFDAEATRAEKALD